MRAKKSRRGKAMAAVVKQISPSVDHLYSSLSSIETTTFMEGLKTIDSNPLHSTALEEDFEVLEESWAYKGRAGEKKVPAKQQRRSVRRKLMETVEETETENEQQQKKRRSARGKGKARTVKGGAAEKKKVSAEEESGPSMIEVEQSFNQRVVKVKRSGQEPEARPAKKQQIKGRKRRSQSGESGKSSGPQSQEEKSDAIQQRRKSVRTSDDDDNDNVEDPSWRETPKRGTLRGLAKTKRSIFYRTKSKRSSSGSAKAKAEKTNKAEGKKRRHRKTQLEEVLDSFVEVCEQHSESVEPTPIKHAIKEFCNNVKEQLMEKISFEKELFILKRENAKMTSLIRQERLKLREAQTKLMRAGSKVSLLQKEKSQLKLRLADLRQTRSFLSDVEDWTKACINYQRT